MKYSLWCVLFGHRFRVAVRLPEDIGTGNETISRLDWCVKCGLTKKEAGIGMTDIPSRDSEKKCCKECYRPENDYDYLLPSGHTVVTAAPEGCGDEECECHADPLQK